MPTSKEPAGLTERPPATRAPVRLRLAEHPGRDELGGGWWPQSSDLAVELAELVQHFPARFGPVRSVLVSAADWPEVPQRVAVADRAVTVGLLPRAQSHQIHLTTSSRAVLQLLVVPPDFTDDQGAEALLAAATSGNAHTAMELLAEVTEHPAVDPLHRWTDTGDSWWEPNPVPPSFRTGRSSWPT